MGSATVASTTFWFACLRGVCDPRPLKIDTDLLLVPLVDPQRWNSPQISDVWGRWNLVVQGELGLWWFWFGFHSGTLRFHSGKQLYWNFGMVSLGYITTLNAQNQLFNSSIRNDRLHCLCSLSSIENCLEFFTLCGRKCFKNSVNNLEIVLKWISGVEW